MKIIIASVCSFFISQIAFSSPITCADASTTQDTIQDSVAGTGDMALPHKALTVHYVGTLCNGKGFDSSVARHIPFTFTLGEGQVIKGWDEGFHNIQVGGKRRIIVPASLAYGHTAVGAIPADSTLIFDIELLEVK